MRPAERTHQANFFYAGVKTSWPHLFVNCESRAIIPPPPPPNTTTSPATPLAPPPPPTPPLCFTNLNSQILRDLPVGRSLSAKVDLASARRAPLCQNAVCHPTSKPLPTSSQSPIFHTAADQTRTARSKDNYDNSSTAKIYIYTGHDSIVVAG